MKKWKVMTLIKLIKKLLGIPNEQIVDATFRSVEEAPIKFHSLTQNGNSSFFTTTIEYKTDGFLKEKTIEKVFDFAYRMTFDNEGEHRSTRSGGSHDRTNGEKFANTFQGKVAECAACNFFYKYDQSVYPDFKVLKLGEWDTVDLTVNGREIAVKSTKHFGQLLMLETKDWDSKGRYIPNVGQKCAEYDAIMLVRMKPSCEDILKKHRLFYSDHVEKNDLYKLLANYKWSYNFVGFITRSDLIELIKQNQIINKGVLLNGRTKMDAQNYYIQAGDLRSMKEYDTLFN